MMKILLTGASSFTGSWFAIELAKAGHQVTATFTGENSGCYQGLRGRRVRNVLQRCDGVFGCRFGDDAFVRLLNNGGYELLCHHGADVTNYKSADFDVIAALNGNCHRLNEVLVAFKNNGGRALLLTGSVFEGSEGAGSDDLPHFSSYGLSKALTSQVFQYACERFGVTFAKFVIPNPFGPFEEERFTAYLVKCWREGKPASVRTPDYVRDNIHVSLLAFSYVKFAERSHGFAALDKVSRCNPSGYVESQGVFSERFAQEIRLRSGWPCLLDLPKQEFFDEPMIRINTQSAASQFPEWEESVAWNELANFYQLNTN